MLLAAPAVLASQHEPQDNEQALRKAELVVLEKGCIQCHDAGPNLKIPSSLETANPQTRPFLTPGFVRALLRDPVRTLPSGRMPDVFVGVPEDRKREEIESLVHYIFEKQPAPVAGEEGVEPGLIDRGRQLYHQVGCVPCHGAYDPPALPIENALPLPDLTSKYTLKDLANQLGHNDKPVKGSRMPDLLLNGDEARAVAAYLLRNQARRDASGDYVTALGKGVRYTVYEGDWQQLPDFKPLKPSGSGVVDGIRIPEGVPEDHFGIVFEATLHIQKGKYQFTLASDDGSKLYLDGALAIDNDGIHPVVEKHATREVSGDIPIRIEFFENAGGQDISFAVRTVGADGKPGEPATFELQHRTRALGIPAADVEFKPDFEGTWNRAVDVFNRRCAVCHDDPQLARRPRAPDFWNLKLSDPDGCASAGAAGRPAYRLGPGDLESLQLLQRHRTDYTKPADARIERARALVAFRCVACHRYDGAGQPGETTIPWFTSLGEAELGDEGRIPPPLTGIDTKIRLKWFREFFAGEHRMRPYMATRMPVFMGTGSGTIGPAGIHIDRLLELRERSRDSDSVPLDGPAFDAAAVEAGQKMTGVGAFSCITCHKFAGNPSLGVPAVDLAYVARKLQFSWFRSYCLDPQSLRPGTRMPQFFPDGKSTLPHVLGGDAEKQIEALWIYLRLGESAPLPKGLRRADEFELSPDVEPLVFRTFITGVGPRAIAIGFPANIHIAIDGNTGALAKAWKGKFISASSAWVARAGQFTDPLSRDVVQWPQGAWFRMSETREPNAVDRSEIHFRGYALGRDAVTVASDVAGSRVEDTWRATLSPAGGVLGRSIQIGGGQPLWLLAASGDEIEMADGATAITARVKSGSKTIELRIAGTSAHTVTGKAGERRLFVQIQPSRESTEATPLSITYDWN
jgi:mono/diheme cytochrome c family protein